MVLQLKYFAKICSFGALRNLSIKMEFVSELWCFHLISILGDPRAASWGDGIFTGKSLPQERESPWAFTLTERVPQAFEIPLADWPDQRAGVQTLLELVR